MIKIALLGLGGTAALALGVMAIAIYSDVMLRRIERTLVERPG